MTLPRECLCPETSWFRARGNRPPRGHDCEYVKRRNALIPEAVREANAADYEKAPWAVAFSRAMDRLAATYRTEAR